MLITFNVLMEVTNKVALAKLQRYCAYQDRCHQEVRTKLLSLKVYGDELEEIISELIKEDFLNEERFARSYARGKFRLKKWGRIKIMQNLKVKNISDYCRKKGMEEIDEDEYVNTLKEILKKQLLKHSDKKEIIAKDKAIKYAINRGYEQSIIYSYIHKIDLDDSSF